MVSMEGLDQVYGAIARELVQGEAEGLKLAAQNQSMRIRESFQVEGVRDGQGQWPPTSIPGLLMRKNVPARLRGTPGLDWHTLVDTGALRDSIHETTVSRGDEGPQIDVIADAPYAADMNDGGTFEGFDIPARNFMYATEEDADRVVEDVTGRLFPNG